MTLNKKYQYIILCEDKQTECFLRHFLVALGVNSRKVHADFTCSKGEGGCGLQFVRDNFSRNLNLVKTKTVSRVLIVAIDADASSLEDRKNELKKVAEYTKDDPLILFIPKRNIETWIENYKGTQVSEEVAYPHQYGKEKEYCADSAKAMAEAFKNNDRQALPSLQDALESYNNICSLIAEN